MAVFTCGVCSIMIVEPAKPGAKVPCPVCGKEMIPRVGPGSLDMGFPDKAARDTAFDFDVPDNVKKIIEERDRQRREAKK